MMKIRYFIIILMVLIGLYSQMNTLNYQLCVQNHVYQENNSLKSVEHLLVLSEIDSNKMIGIKQSSGTVSNFFNHDLIKIIGNEDFITQALAENWIGEGTKSNPYIIDSLNITNSGELISISNTDLFFKINNCILIGGEETAISFSNVSNGFITNNTIYNYEMYGISLTDNSSNVIIQDNYVYLNILTDNRYAISVIDSDDNFIYNNTLYNTEEAIQLLSSSNNRIISNNVLDNNKGIYLGSNSEANIISNNNVKDNQVGIIIESDNNTLSDNSLFNNKKTGIRLYSSNYHTISSNDIVSNYFYGINCNHSNHNSIYSNSFSVNGNTGLYLVNSNNNVIRWNNFGKDQAIDDGSQNAFNLNYWSDVSGHSDQNDDGIIDWTMDILGSASSRDHNPLKTTHRLNFALLYPNGGEILSKAVTIEWKVPLDTYDHDLTYSVFYYSDKVKWWVLLATDLSTNMYEWDTTTISHASNCRIKVVVSCSENLMAEDISDAMFTVKNELTKPVVIFPNGGEILENKSITIRWLESIDSSGHDITYSVSYSKDNGTTWNSLNSGLVTTSYEWDTSSLADGTKYLIKVVATCSEGLTVEDTSDQTFSIKRGAALAPFFEFILIALPAGYFLKRVRKRKKAIPLDPSE